MQRLNIHASELLCRVPGNDLHRILRASVVLALLAGGPGLRAFDAETIGVTAMRRERPGIIGTGISVAQPEGEEGPGAWQTHPGLNPLPLYSWTSDGGTTTNFPNALGSVSGHAFQVGALFYGSAYGVAPGVTSVDSYDANYFIDSVVVLKQPMRARVINQSFIITELPSTTVDPYYDAYTEQYDVLFISAMNNAPDKPPAPGTAYNSIGVGRFYPDSPSSIGPTIDGRSKPDLVAPEAATSYAAPNVAGGAALLLQAAAANDGGPDTAALATNASTIKALLLNGAVKTTNWTNGVTRPLDARYGAGVLNVYNSDRQLRGGRFAAIVTNSAPLTGTHPTNDVPSLHGWDYSSQTTDSTDRVAHYYFTLPTNGASYSATATLVWKKGSGPLTNLDLFLYSVPGNTLVAASTSAVDNVEHIFVPNMPPGRYALQVFKHGEAEQAGAETYALAFDFSPVRISIARAGTNSVLAWPASPAGFVLQSTSTLNSPIAWQVVTNQFVLSNAQNTVTLSASDSARFFRLFRP